MLVRLSLAGHDLKPGQLAGLAQAAQAYGNGRLDVTRRGNLQIRGCTERSIAPLREMLSALQLPHPDGVVVRAGLAGLDGAERADPRPVADAVEAALRDAALPLSPKATIVVDGGDDGALRSLRPHILVKATGMDSWTLETIDTRLHDCRHADVPGHVLHLLRAGLPDRRAPSSAVAKEAVGVHVLSDGRRAVGVLPPYGAVTASQLSVLARAGVDGFRLGQDGMVFAICTGDVERVTAYAASVGFIVDPADERRAVSACVGQDGCASAHLATRPLADRLAAIPDVPRPLHVSGCAKGCAHPGPAALTIVGREANRAMVVRNGSARDSVGLEADATPLALGALLRRAAAA